MDLIAYLVSEVTTQKLLLFLVLSAGPTLFWLLLCLRLDRMSPEPKYQIFKIFIWGAVLTLPIIFIAGYLTKLVEGSSYFSAIVSIFVLSFLIDGLIEESGKYIILRFRTYKSLYFDELRDGFIYGMVLGLGLAFVENILYGLVVGNIGEGSTTILLRGVTTTLLHFLTGGIIGYYVALAKFSKIKGKFVSLKGVFLAILLHGLYNTIVRFDWWWNMIPLALVLLTVYIIVLVKIKKLNGPQAPRH